MPSNPHVDRPTIRPMPGSDLEATVGRTEEDPNATRVFDIRDGTAPDDSASTMDGAALMPGSYFGGNFRLEQQLGRGGMGEAWKAHDETADRYVVLKFVPKEIQHIQAAMDSVRSSFKKAHSLQHQHICPLYGLLTDPAHGLYVVMKYVDGVSVDEYRRRIVQRRGRMPFTDAVHILWATARALDYAHEKKIIHRDIKPQNIMISKVDGVQIIDFGLAEEIRMSMIQYSEVSMGIVGTRPYMAPEQWRGRMQDARTDQYALAATAYELLAGCPPFQGCDIGILRECVLHDEPEPIDGVPDHVNDALLRALAKKRDDRFDDCRTFIRAMVERPRTEEYDLTDDQLAAAGSGITQLPPETESTASSAPVWLPKSVFGSVSRASTSSGGAESTPRANLAASVPFPDVPLRYTGHSPQTVTPQSLPRIVITEPAKPEAGPRMIRASTVERAVLYSLIVFLLILLMALTLYLSRVTSLDSAPAPKSKPKPRVSSGGSALKFQFPNPVSADEN